MDRRIMFMKKSPQGGVCPCPGAIYMYMYMTIKFKHLLCNCLASQSQTLCGASLEKGNENKYKWFRSCDQDGRHGYK